MTYPEARRQDLVVHAHGEQLADPYRWLEDRTSPEATAWLSEQQRLFDAHAVNWPRAAFRDRLRQQFGTGMVGLPTLAGGRAFYVYRSPESQHLAQYVREPDGSTRAVIDPDVLDPTGLTTADLLAPAPDGKLAVALISRGGDEASALSVIDVDTGETLEGPLDRCHALYSPIAWLPDGAGFHYVRCLLPAIADASPLPGSMWQLRRHLIGRPFEDDEVIDVPAQLSRTDALFPSISPDGRWLLVTVTDMMPGVAGDLYVADLHGDAQLRPLLVGRIGELQAVWGSHGRLFVRTTQDAPRWRVGVIHVGSDDESLRPLIPEPPAPQVLRAAVALPEHLVLRISEQDETSRLAVHDSTTGARVAHVPLPGTGAVGGPVTNAEDPERIWFVYGDHRQPQDAYTWSLGDRECQEWMRRPGSLDSSAAVVRRLEIPGHDGALIPVVVMHVGDLDGPRPALLQAYGGFGYSVLTPSFDHWGSAWAALGGLYVTVGARGGGEKGEAWHHAGRRGNKMNTFRDVVSVARWLRAQGWTTAEQTGMSGLSNGGVTAAVLSQQWPDDFAAVVPCAMFTDLLAPLREDTSDVWAEEYGDGRLPEEFAWIRAYSPYHNAVDGRCYPAMLVCVFGQDTRTPAVEGHKYVALMQHAQGCDRPVLLRHEENAGHSTRSVDSMVELLTDWLAFLAHHLGLQVPADASSNGS